MRDETPPSLATLVLHRFAFFDTYSQSCFAFFANHVGESAHAQDPQDDGHATGAPTPSPSRTLYLQRLDFLDTYSQSCFPFFAYQDVASEHSSPTEREC